MIGISTPILPTSAFPTDEELKRVINETHMQGGVVTINHIPWSVPNRLAEYPSLQQLYSWGVDFIEVVNENVFDYQGYVFALEHNMGVVAGTWE